MVGWEYPTKPREASGLDPEAVHNVLQHDLDVFSTYLRQIRATLD